MSTLPSPAHTLPPPPSSAAAPGPPPPPSPHTAHLRDLQHQLSTKTLAHRILQAEHDQLLGTYSRLRTRCEALDRGARGAAADLAALGAERGRLADERAAAQRQAAALAQGRDEAQRASAASGGQYLQIVALSAKLQAQGAEEERRWKAEREAWAAERRELRARIRALEDRRAGGEAGAGRADGEAGAGRADGEEGERGAEEDMDGPALRAEVARLRGRQRQMEAQVEAYKAEAASISRILGQLGEVSSRVNRVGSHEAAPS